MFLVLVAPTTRFLERYCWNHHLKWKLLK